MGCAAGLPTDRASLEAVKSGDVQKGALKSNGSQDFSQQASERSTRASSSGAVLIHVQSNMVDADNALTASNFNRETGAPDMGNGPLRINLRNEQQWFQNTRGGNPQDFPRLAREFTRRRRRPQASTADQSELQLWCESGESSPGGTRRFSTPVLAEARFDEPSSLQTEAEMWRLWSAKDLPLTSFFVDQEGRDSKAELDCTAQEFASLTSTCLPQAEHETILEDEEAAESAEDRSRPLRRSHVPPVEDSVSSSALVEQIRGALHKALADDPVEEVVAIPDAQHGSGREDVLIMLDWDDTVLPTTWLASKPWFRAWVNTQASLEPSQLMDAKDLEALQEIDMAACEFLEEIHRWGQVVCITLAQRPWVQQSMKAFLPRLAQRWEDLGIPVHYAVEEYARKNRWGSWCHKSSGPSLLESTVLEMNLRATQKFKVMNRLLRRFYRSKDCCNAISIGDGLAERNGLKEIALSHDRLMEVSSEKHLQAKTIQMLEDPTCLQLARELQVLKAWLPCVIRCNEDLDAVLG